ncbi:hypothetical protein ACEG43_16870 [Streptomyces aureus]|uniref:Uncharacterized protein n=1 Tax=Streptomyces aureus TaxID=193461 RepID=A0ABV4SIV9_9ACTN
MRNTPATPRAAARGSAGAVDEHRQGQAYPYREAESFEDEHGMIHRDIPNIRPVSGQEVKKSTARSSPPNGRPNVTYWSVLTGHNILHGL